MENIKKAFADVRTAHRLIYEYQRRVLDLLFYLRGRFGFSEHEIAARKCFSATIGNTRRYNKDYSDVSLKIPKDMWAWDFLYSYVMEFYFGEKEDKQAKKRFSMSVIEVSDTGFYASNQENRDETDIKSFADIDESETLILFVFEAISNRKQKYQFWDTSEDKIREWIISSENLFTSDDSGDTLLVKKVPMEKMLNKESTDRVIDEFMKCIKKRIGIDLNKNEK